MRCRTCANFRLHLERVDTLGLCSKWCEVVESESNCDFYHRLIGDFPHDPLSINGKTYPDYLALNKGYCWVTGNQLSYDFIKAVALKYKIDISLIEKFKININAEQTKIKV